MVVGRTVKLAYLSQEVAELDPTWRVLEAVERVRQRVDLGKGREMTASQLCERFGFAPGDFLFVDDSLKNIEAAAKVGLDVHHFADPADLRPALERRGLL